MKLSDLSLLQFIIRKSHENDDEKFLLFNPNPEKLAVIFQADISEH
jgi:hypothetical protein